MKKYLTVRDAEPDKLKNLINLARGSRTMAELAQHIKAMDPDIKVSAATISRACNLSAGTHASMELLEAIAECSASDNVTIVQLAEANGMMEENAQDAEKIKKIWDTQYRSDAARFEQDAIVTVQNDLLRRGLLVAACTYRDMREVGVFARPYDLSYRVGDGINDFVWLFELKFIGSNDKNWANKLLNVISKVIASDCLEYELHRDERYTLAISSRKAYEQLIGRLQNLGARVKGYVSIALLDTKNMQLLDEYVMPSEGMYKSLMDYEYLEDNERLDYYDEEEDY